MKQKLLYIAFGVVCSLLGAGIVFLASRPPHGRAIQLSPPPTPRMWVVQVSGAVVQPGVYELPAGSRVRDAVQAAGGLSPAADVAGINLAAFLVDGQNILIPDGTALLTEPAQRGNPLSQPGEPDPGQGISVNAASAGLVNINTAALEELDGLPEIGPALGQSIIDYRTQNGPFVVIEDIMKVPGIGQVTFEQFRNLITVGP